MDLKQFLGEELYNQVTSKLGDKKIMVDDGNFIPKARFDQVNEQKKELDNRLTDYKTQLEDLSKNNKDNETLVKQIEELQLTNKQASEQYENKIKAMEFDYALDNALNSSKCKNSKAIKALLDMESIKYQDGKLEGLESQIKGLRESDSYLFEELTPQNTGGVGNYGRKGQSVANPWAKETFNLTEQARILKENPTLAEQLKNNK